MAAGCSSFFKSHKPISLFHKDMMFTEKKNHHLWLFSQHSRIYGDYDHFIAKMSESIHVQPCDNCVGDLNILANNFKPDCPNNTEDVD
jgi:hypothetical protein